MKQILRSVLTVGCGCRLQDTGVLKARMREASQTIELKRCHECGVAATVIHMYDTYDRADFGWSAGCGRYSAGDGHHTKEMKVSLLPSKEKAIEAWNRRTYDNY